MNTYNLADQSVRELNQALHDLPADATEEIEVLNPNGAHAVACGIDAPVDVRIVGHTGYYSAGMHKLGRVTIEGNVGIVQFLRVGTMAYVGAMSKITKDVPPYAMVGGVPARKIGERFPDALDRATHDAMLDGEPKAGRLPAQRVLGVRGN